MFAAITLLLLTVGMLQAARQLRDQSAAVDHQSRVIGEQNRKLADGRGRIDQLEAEFRRLNVPIPPPTTTMTTTTSRPPARRSTTAPRPQRRSTTTTAPRRATTTTVRPAPPSTTTTTRPCVVSVLDNCLAQIAYHPPQPKENPTVLATLSPATAETWRWLVALAIPLLVGLLTRSSASSGLKSVTNTVLVALDTAVTALLDARGAHTSLIIRQFIEAAVISYGTYYGFWKQTGIAGTVAAATANFGIGSPPVLETADKGAEDEGLVPEQPTPPTTTSRKRPAKKSTS